MRQTLADNLAELHKVAVSQRELLRYMERCRIRLHGHCVVAWRDAPDGEGKEACAIPILNTALLLLGPGTSVSAEAMEALAAANVVVGFTGGSGTPLNAGVEPIVFATGVSEYRPTQYMQSWASWWFDEQRRLQKARQLLAYRAELLEQVWSSDKMTNLFRSNRLPAPNPAAFFASVPGIGKKAGAFGFASKIGAPEYAESMFGAVNIQGLCGQEGVHVQSLYQYFARSYAVKFEGRHHQDGGGVNGLLTQGNYVAYGMAAVALHALGISFAFPVLHGKTRRGALVFDVADPVKDAVVVPLAFLAAKTDMGADDYRVMLKEFLEDSGILGRVIDKLKELALA